MAHKNVKNGCFKPERVKKLSNEYSILKRAPLDYAEIKKIQESIAKGKSHKFCK